MSCFQNVPKHSVYSETFRFVLYTFQKCSGQFSRLFRNVQICFRDITKVFQNIKTFSKVFRNILTCLVVVLFLECSETFSLFQNIQICSGNISKILRNIKTFSDVPKLSDYSETFRFVLGTIQDCSGKCSGKISRLFWKHSDLFMGHFKSVPKY